MKKKNVDTVYLANPLVPYKFSFVLHNKDGREFVFQVDANSYYNGLEILVGYWDHENIENGFWGNTNDGGDYEDKRHYLVFDTGLYFNYNKMVQTQREPNPNYIRPTSTQPPKQTRKKKGK